MKRRSAGGGWPAIWYTLRKSRRAGGVFRMIRALRSKNACKTCALGMGGQMGGMTNERGRWPEVCKKSVQAMAADMQGGIHPHFFNDFSLDQLRAFSPRELEAAGRLVQPVIAGPLDSHYRPVEWDEALDRIAAKLARTAPDESFFYFSGRSSNEAGFLLQLFARLYGTNNVNNCSYYCHQASGVGLSSVTGSGTATITLDDVDRCDLLILLGGNPASNHPRFMRSLVDLKRRGGHVIVVNPLKEVGLVRFRVPSDVRSLFFGSTIADLYIQPHIGGDIAFLAGVARALIQREQFDRAFVEKHAVGFADFRASIEALTWDAIIRESGVDRATIERAAAMYARSRGTIFAWTMGITHHAHGVDNVRMIANLAMLRGMLGRAGAGLLPLRGHSNVQGIGSVGATPALKQAVFDRLQSHFGVQLPTTHGMDTLACLDAADLGRVRAAIHLGGNLYGSNPDSTFAANALSRIDLTVFLSTTLNTGHAWGRGRESIILPVLARDEEPQPTTQESMFNFVRLSDGGPRRHDGPRSEVEVISDLAARTFAACGRDTPIDWAALCEHRRIREAIAAIVPGFEQLASIDDTKKEFHIPGRVFHEPTFPTESGRAKFHVVPLPRFDASSRPARSRDAEGRHHVAWSRSRLTQPARDDVEREVDRPLRLMTIRSEGQFNTVVYEEEDIYRGLERRDVILLARHDINRLRLQPDDLITVRSNAGALANVRVREADIRAGNAAMYYPEANMLVPRVVDEQSRTPCFKSVLVTIERMSGEAGASNGTAFPVGAGTTRGPAPRKNDRAC